MEFAYSDRCNDYLKRVSTFMDRHVYDGNEIYEKQHDEFGPGEGRWKVPPIIEELKDKAKSEGLWNMFHPDQQPRKSYLETVLEGEEGPFIAASDYVRAVSEQVSQWVPGGLYCLGTDGMGRSETREALRRHFEVDAECITVAALYRLAKAGEIEMADVAKAIKELEIDPEKVNPLFA